MASSITAIYEHGVFIPEIPVDLPEHTTVIVALPAVRKKVVTKRYAKLIDEPLIIERLDMPSRESLYER